MDVLGVSFSLAVRFVCKLRGGSQPVLVETSDGALVVLKFRNNPQGPNVLFNECAGQELYRACGLEIAPWFPVLVSDEFLDRNPGSWMSTSDGVKRPESGLCYGSRFLGFPDARLLEVLPGSYLSRIRNRNDFWLAWLVDVCAMHTDARQALYIQDQNGHLLTHFVDMGNMFGGPCGLKQPHLLASRYLDSRVYPEVTSGLARSILHRVRNADTDRIWDKIEEIPAAWRTPAAVSGLEQCLNRLKNAQLLQQFLEMMIASHLQRGESGQYTARDSGSLRRSLLHSRIPSQRIGHETVLAAAASGLACH